MTYMMTMQYNAQLCSSQKFQLNDREDEDWPFIIVNGAILKTIFNMAFMMRITVFQPMDLGEKFKKC